MQDVKRRISKKYLVFIICAGILVLAAAAAAVWMMLNRPNIYSRLTDLEKNLSDMTEKYDKAASERQVLSDKVDSLTDELDSLTEELESAAKENEQLSKGLDEAQKTIDELKKRLYTEKPMAYFTFDDGPSKATETVLDILGKNNVKATFFVIGPESTYKKALLKRIHDEGHLLAVHSYTHQYKSIYASKDAFFSDFDRIENLIKNATGVQPFIYRFPGGSSTGYLKREVFDKVVPALASRGYGYIDWNIDSGDTKTVYPNSDNVSKSILNQCRYRLNHSKNKSCVILMHDAQAKKDYIGKTLNEIIPKLRSMGFSFEALNEYTPAAQFRKYPLS